MRTRRSALWVSLFSVSLPFFGCGGEPSEKCEAGYFSSLDGMCEALTECTGNQYETAAPTETSDRRCAPLTVCAAEEFEVRPPTATRDRDCAPVTVCMEGEYEVTAPTASSDRVCMALSTCLEGEYESIAPTATSDRACASISTCELGWAETQPPTDTSDRACRQCQRWEYCAGGVTPAERCAWPSPAHDSATIPCAIPIEVTTSRNHACAIDSLGGVRC